MRQRTLAATLCATLALLCLLSSGVALARPGGGGHYSGGGGYHGGGGGYHGGGGGFHVGGGYHGGGATSGDTADVVFLVVLVLIVVVLAAARRRSVGADLEARAALFGQESDALASLRSTATLEAIHARDPALTFESIEARVRRMNDVLREAWCAGDMKPARPFVSDGVFSRFQVQLALIRGEGLRNVMDDAEVLYVTLEAVESAAPLDVVHVRFTARARDAMVPTAASAADVARALARSPVEEYSEIWSLVRRHGATTTRPAGDVGRACPSCGASLLDAQGGGATTLGEMIRCRYCAALLCSGEHDWVLAEITQVSAWHPSRAPVEGLEALRARDPELTREVLEDRASYLFWKWIEAARSRSITPLRKGATPEFLASRARLESAATTRDLAVGGADLVLVEPAEGGGLDHAYVKVFWSAAFEPGAQHVPIQSVLRLARKTGVVTRASLTALLCASCGAPIGDGDTPACDHCGALLAEGDHAWVLDAVEPPGSLEAAARRRTLADRAALPAWMIPNVADPRERSVLFAQMAATLAADGAITRRERELLAMVARRWGIPRETVEACLARPRALSDDGLQSAKPEWFLAGLVAAALADGTIDPREQALLDRACAALRLPREELARQIDGCRERLRRDGLEGTGATA